MLSQLKCSYRISQKSNTRFTVVVSGSKEWSRQCAWDVREKLLAQRFNGSILPTIAWIGEKTGSADIDSYRKDSLTMLGSDYDCVVLDAWSGFNPDVLGQVAGTLKGGGLLLLLTPEFTIWPDFFDPDYQRSEAIRPTSNTFSGNYIRRFIRFIEQADSDSLQCLTETNTRLADIGIDIGIGIDVDVDVDETSTINEENVRVIDSEHPAPAEIRIQPTSQQLHVVDEIVSFVNGKTAKRPSNLIQYENDREVVLLQADRGRGKTVALGFAIAELLLVNTNDVIVTAPLKSNVANLFAIVEQQLGLEENCSEAFSQSLNRVKFIALDKLVLDLAAKKSSKATSSAITFDILVVDEAAGIPIAVLDQLEKGANRVVFSTTLDGYEGSGSGFVVRFLEPLRRQQRQIKLLTLTKPLRWSEQDFLEPFINRVLLLNSNPSTKIFQQDDLGSVSESLVEQTNVQKISSAMLLSSESLLTAIFGLLREAHYQTRPSDLRYLLDVPYVHLWVVTKSADNVLEQKFASTEIVGVLLACEEGGFSANSSLLLEQIRTGRRRPRGNLLAQRLCHYGNDTTWCESSSLRVMRIAVEESSRKTGVASLLINTMTKFAIAEGCSYWGSSFSYAASSLGFWQSLNVVIVNIGLRLETASGARNIMIVKPLNEQLGSAAAQLAIRLSTDLSYWHSGYMPELTAHDVGAMSTIACYPQLSDSSDLSLAQQDEAELRRYFNTELGFDRIYPAFIRRYRASLPRSKNEFLDKVAEHAPDWTRLASELGYTGKKQLLNALKLELIRCLID